MDSPLNVAIIGAGLGGLTLARTLLSHGEGRVQVTIYEAWSEWKVRGGALGLVAGRRVLEALGLEKGLAQVANGMAEPLELRYFTGQQQLNALALPACIGLRTDLQQLLVSSLPEGTVKLGHKLVDIVEHEHEVLLSFENGLKASVDLVVASDGIHSFVRQRIFGMDRPVYTGFRVLYSVCSKPIRPDPLKAHVTWNEQNEQGYGVLDLTAGVGDHRRDVCVLIMRSEESDNERWDSTIVKERFAEIAKKAAPQHEVLQRALEHAEVCFDWGIYRQAFCKTWISPKGHVVLLGDAAHATAPFMGQGANMAMHDAYALGQLLVQEELSDALRLYEAHRKSFCQQVVAKSSKIGELHTASGWKATLRNHLLCFLMLRQMRSVMATDPTEKPWEHKTLFQRLGLRLKKMCA